MKIVTAIDSFKGSMTSAEANEVVKKALPDHHVVALPIADGGEGTVEAFTDMLNGELIEEPITGPDQQIIAGKYGWVKEKALAVIEVAEGAGITKVPSTSLHPKAHTSYGVGEQILSALERGASRLFIGLGGSATVDGGIGMLQALGVRFFDSAGGLLPVLPVELGKVAHIDASQLDKRLLQADITVASDVTAPLCGENGAVFVFGPQKGILEAELETFDQSMLHYQKIVNRVTKTNKQHEPGAGAAGGIGFALYSFFDAHFESGLELLAKEGNFAAAIKDADLVITGEGKFDRQSRFGKVPIGLSRIANACQVPVIVFAGSVEGHLLALPEENIIAVLPIVDEPMALDEAIEKGPILLFRAVKRLFHLMSLSVPQDTSLNTP